MARAVAALALIVACGLALAVAVPTHRLRKTLQARSHQRVYTSSFMATAAMVGEPLECADKSSIPTVAAKDKATTILQSEKFLKYPGAAFSQKKKLGHDGKTVEVSEYNVQYADGEWAIPNNGKALYHTDDFLKKEFQMTQAGKDLLPVVASMLKWAETHAMPLYERLMKVFERVETYKNQREVRAIVAPVKAASSAVPKIGRDYLGNPRQLVDAVRGSFVYQTIADLKEGLCAFSKWVGDTGYPSLNSAKCKILHHKNRLEGSDALASGYKDVLVTLMCNVGADKDKRDYLMEIQFHVCAFMMVKQGEIKTINSVLESGFDKTGHEYYEMQRKLVEPDATDKVKYPLGDKDPKYTTDKQAFKKENDDLNALQVKMYDRAAEPVGEQCKMIDAPKWAAKELADNYEEAEEAQKMFDSPENPWNSANVKFTLVGFDTEVKDVEKIVYTKEALDKFEENKKKRAATVKARQEAYLAKFKKV